jgi:hypothetical protein
MKNWSIGALNCCIIGRFSLTNSVHELIIWKVIRYFRYSDDLCRIALIGALSCSKLIVNCIC